MRVVIGVILFLIMVGELGYVLNQDIEYFQHHTRLGHQIQQELKYELGTQ